eukprot:4245597-Pleurochrysis_carterae.AAC.1
MANARYESTARLHAAIFICQRHFRRLIHFLRRVDAGTDDDSDGNAQGRVNRNSTSYGERFAETANSRSERTRSAQTEACLAPHMNRLRESECDTRLDYLVATRTFFQLSASRWVCKFRASFALTGALARACVRAR